MSVICLENTTKQKLARNELVLCMAVNQMRTPDVALIAATCGFDAIFIDMEHGPTSLESASAVSVAALGYGITPLAAWHALCTRYNPDARLRIADATGNQPHP